MSLELTPIVNKNLTANKFTMANKKPNQCKVINLYCNFLVGDKEITTITSVFKLLWQQQTPIEAKRE